MASPRGNHQIMRQRAPFPNRRPTPTRSSHALGSTTVAADITYGSCTRSTSSTTTTPCCHHTTWQPPIDAQRLLAHRTPWGRQQWQPASPTAPAGLHHQRPPHPAATRFCGSSQSTPNAYSLIARLGVDNSGSLHHLRLPHQVYIINDDHTLLPPYDVAAPNRRPTPTRSSHALGSTAVAASITYGSCRSTSPTTTTPRCHQILWQLPIDAQRLLAHRTPWGRQQWQPTSPTAPTPGLHHQRRPHPAATIRRGSP